MIWNYRQDSAADCVQITFASAEKCKQQRCCYERVGRSLICNRNCFYWNRTMRGMVPFQSSRGMCRASAMDHWDWLCFILDVATLHFWTEYFRKLVSADRGHLIHSLFRTRTVCQIRKCFLAPSAVRIKTSSPRATRPDTIRRRTLIHIHVVKRRNAGSSSLP